MMIVILLVIFSSCIRPITSSDLVSVNQSLRVGETRVSGNYTLGFFTPSQSSPNRYLGIWFSFSPEKVVWVANRESPINDTSAALRVTEEGSLELSSSAKGIFWRTQISGSLTGKPVAQLRNTGNLVVRNENDDADSNFLWQSFDNHTDVFLAKSRMGLNHFLQSWKTPEDPSLGDAVFELDSTGWPQHFIKVKGSIVFRSGPWDGLAFAGIKNVRSSLLLSFWCSFEDTGFYCIYDVTDPSTFSILQLENDGALKRFNYNSNAAKKWELYSVLKTDDCDIYARCGPYGICEYGTSTKCSCLPGFFPKSPEEWTAGNWTGGCVRKKELACGGRYNFTQIDGLKLPDSSKSWSAVGANLSECNRLCSMNCSCAGYLILDTTNSGCVFWPWELLDTRRYDSGGQSFYLKSDAGKKSTLRRNVGIAVFVGAAALLGLFLILLLLKWTWNKHQRLREMKGDNGGEETEFALFDLETIVKATNNFSSNLKLGDGGFGSVFKGILEDGQEIAVKRLSEKSGQGITEFKNEANLIAKLQHRNLVKLFGCCIYGKEKMLVYEFMPNKSLNHFIFDSSRRKTLDWEKLMEIIDGIARGLMYLHQDSRLRIIHRDLKASNILLDSTMTPKISDFGMARLMKEDEQESMTLVVVGTYGYISPEYAIDGVFSTKSDVFSFGVMVLEIISGKKNRGFRHRDHDHNLIGHAWKLWMEARPMELVDQEEAAMASFPQFLVLRCIHVGLLCVQHRPDDRPSISSVLHMLSSDTELPQPKQPGFFAARSMPDSDISASNSKTVSQSANQLTITLYGR